MSENMPWQKLLDDPLRDVTRKERRALLAVSIVALVVAKTGILPGKIASIGIEVSSADKPALLFIFAGVIAYLLLAFMIYAASDFIVWQRSYYELIDKLAFERAERQYKAEQEGATNVIMGFEAIDKRKETWKVGLRNASAPTSVARAIVEFLLPIGTGLFAFVSLLLSAAR